jgi:transcriptional repressor NrdR
MRCPFCRIDNDRVIDSRATNDGFSIRRRRECLHCKRRFSTSERVEEMNLKVVKRKGVREPFSREKVRQGIERACWKRPVSDEQIDAAVSRVETEIVADYENEITSSDLGELVMKELAKLDQVAYVRFASVYRKFKDVQDFVQELEPILQQQRKKGKS